MNGTVTRITAKYRAISANLIDHMWSDKTYLTFVLQMTTEVGDKGRGVERIQSLCSVGYQRPSEVEKRRLINNRELISSRSYTTQFPTL